MEQLTETDAQKIEQYMRELEQQRVKAKIILKLREKRARCRGV